MLIDATCFRGSRRYTIVDRDGYDDELYTVHSLLRFYADGTLDCLESNDGRFDAPWREPEAPHLRGSWSREKNGLIAFTLERVLPVCILELEIPNGGRDHHFYPTTGELDCGLEGTHTARLNRNRLTLSEGAVREHTLLGKRVSGFPH